MSEIKTSRPFQQRFLDGFDRSELRAEVQKVKPRFGGLKKKYATWALGASLAFGGLGIPAKMMIHPQAEPSHTIQTQSVVQVASDSKPATAPANADQPADLSGDVQAAAAIAHEVAGGVTGGVQAVASGVSGGVQAVASGVASVATAPLQTVAEAPKALSTITDSIQQQFFTKEVPFGSVIYTEAKKNSLPPELLAAVVHTESQFNPAARSAAGAIGLMQLVPRTGRWMGAHDLTNPVENITAGAKYLKYLNDRFDGDQVKTIAAYNAGEGNVRRFNGVPPFRETRNYVERVNRFQQDLGVRLASQADLATTAAQ